MTWIKDNLERAKRLAKIREDLHLNHKSHRPLSKGYEVIGVYGEMKFEAITGYPMDEGGHIQGDRGIDFRTPAGNIDVKTAKSAPFLIIEKGKCHTDIIYVLAQIDYIDVTMLGWEHGSVMAERPYKPWPPKGVINHYKAMRQLRPMESLYDQLEMIGVRP
jgi:hypothetical protein